METVDELIARVVELLPEATVEELNGELVVWTGMKESGGRLVMVEPVTY